jgi:hypothetical protein
MSVTNKPSWYLQVILLAAVIGGGPAAPALATSRANSCRVSVPVTMRAPGRAHPDVRRFTSSTGTAQCAGNLGPWLMGGQPGWSTVAGTFTTSPGGASRPPQAGVGRLWASVPRFAWFHPSMVPFTITFRLRRVGRDLVVTGAGRLQPTFKSPLEGSFRIIGTATLTGSPRRPRPPAAQKGLLALQFTVQSTSDMPASTGPSTSAYPGRRRG